MKLQSNLILEILGRPQEHVKETLNTLAVRLGSEKGVKVTNTHYHDPIPAENSDSLFSAFAELDVEFESLEALYTILFSYLPAHIEIISPESLSQSNNDLNDLTNAILKRMHDYDAITKKALYERELLLKKLKEVAPEIFDKEVDKIKKESEKISDAKKDLDKSKD